MMLSLAGRELRLRPMRRFAGHWRYGRSSQAIVARACDRLVGAGSRCLRDPRDLRDLRAALALTYMNGDLAYAKYWLGL